MARPTTICAGFYTAGINLRVPVNWFLLMDFTAGLSTTAEHIVLEKYGQIPKNTPLYSGHNFPSMPDIQIGSVESCWTST